jgi:hypothetical protein
MSGMWPSAPTPIPAADPGVEKHIVSVVLSDQGEETLTPDEFAKKYGWQNDPEKVRLLGK